MKIRRQVATGRGRNPKQDKRTQYGNPKAGEKYVRNMGPDGFCAASAKQANRCDRDDWAELHRSLG